MTVDIQPTDPLCPGTTGTLLLSAFGGNDTAYTYSVCERAKIVKKRGREEEREGERVGDFVLI